MTCLKQSVLCALRRVYLSWIASPPPPWAMTAVLMHIIARFIFSVCRRIFTFAVARSPFLQFFLARLFLSIVKHTSQSLVHRQPIPGSRDPFTFVQQSCNTRINPTTMFKRHGHFTRTHLQRIDRLSLANIPLFISPSLAYVTLAMARHWVFHLH